MAVEMDEDEVVGQEGEPDLDKLQTDFAFRGPVNLRLMVEEKADEAKLSVTQFLKKITADAVGYALQSNPGRAVMTEEERNAKIEAAKQAAKDERARVRAVMEAQRKDKEAAPA